MTSRRSEGVAPDAARIHSFEVQDRSGVRHRVMIASGSPSPVYLSAEDGPAWARRALHLANRVLLAARFSSTPPYLIQVWRLGKKRAETIHTENGDGWKRGLARGKSIGEQITAGTFEPRDRNKTRPG